VDQTTQILRDRHVTSSTKDFERFLRDLNTFSQQDEVDLENANAEKRI